MRHPTPYIKTDYTLLASGKNKPEVLRFDFLCGMPWIWIIRVHTFRENQIWTETCAQTLVGEAFTGRIDWSERKCVSSHDDVNVFL